MKVYDMYLSIKETPKWNSGTEEILHIFDDVLTSMKEHHPDMYKETKMKLYVAVNGYHFNQHMLDDVYATMVNDNGTPAPKWSMEDTTSVARNMGIVFDKFNEYDWNYAMNMIYSDYSEVLGENVQSYSRMAVKFLDDKDAPEGKALRYAMCMKY